MRSAVVYALLIFILFFHSAHSIRVLQVVTSIGRWMPSTGPAGIPGSWKPTGYWLSEFTHSYDVFKTAGWDVDIASPFGGLGPADPQGFQFYANDPTTQKYVATRNGNESYVPLTENTLNIANVKWQDYDAVFLVGGTGAMFDFPFSAPLKTLVRNMWEAGKIVSAVCHGPIGLADVTLSNGKYLVDGKLMTAFSNAEEVVLGRVNVCVFCYLGYESGCNASTCDGPYMPTEYYVKRNSTAGLDNKTGVPSALCEDQLKLRGAKYVSTNQDWNTFYFRPHVVVDGRLVTGQNPGAGRETAQAVVETVDRLIVKGQTNTELVVQTTFCSNIVINPTDPPVTCQSRGILEMMNENVSSDAIAMSASVALLFINFMVMY